MVIRVLVVDDHAIVRDGLSRLIAGSEGMTVVGTAADGGEAVARAGAGPVDVVLMDLSMPGMDGAEATQRLTASHPSIRVVVLTSFSDDRRIRGALDAGAVGYLLKDAEPGEITAAIRTAMAGDAPLHPKAARVLLESIRTPGNVRELSRREREVLALVAEGLPNKRIARRLGISERTVKAHLTSVFQTLGVGDRTQAALWAREHLVP